MEIITLVDNQKTDIASEYKYVFTHLSSVSTVSVFANSHVKKFKHYQVKNFERKYISLNEKINTML